MKIVQVLAIALLYFLSVPGLQGQVHYGMIEYEVTIDIHRNIPPEREELKAMIPQFQTVPYQLIFNDTESLYKPKDDPDADLSRGRGPGGGGGMRMMRVPRAETHINKTSREVTVAQDFMGTNYLIAESLEIAPWRIGDQVMDIEGYMCMMAWYTDTVQNQEITAWFTPQIQPFLGPDRYVTLPGTVLAVDVNNGERVWVARKIEIREVRSSELRKPNRGQRISREDFNKMVQEQMERMGARGAAFRF